MSIADRIRQATLDPEYIQSLETIANAEHQATELRAEHFTTAINDLNAIPLEIEREWLKGLLEATPNIDEICQVRALQHNQTLDLFRDYFATITPLRGASLPQAIDIQAMESRVWERVTEFERGRDLEVRLNRQTPEFVYPHPDPAIHKKQVQEFSAEMGMGL